MMNRVTAVIISFLRPEYTMECVRSLAERYEGIKILVGENGEYNRKLANHVRRHGGKYFLMPFDSGVCFARNRLVELADTEFVLVGDDDFFYTEEANVDKMTQFLEVETEFDLVGGRVRENDVVKNYQGTIDINDDHLHYHAIEAEAGEESEAGIRYQKCDITFNYFVARREKAASVKWDELIKVAFEHSDWFISMKKAGMSIAYTPDAIVVHKPNHVKVKDIGLYKAFRHRRNDKDRFFQKHNIAYSIGLNGARSTYTPEDGVRRALRTNELQPYTIDRNYEQDGRTYLPGEIVWTTRPFPWMVPADIRTNIKESFKNR